MVCLMSTKKPNYTGSLKNTIKFWELKFKKIIRNEGHGRWDKISIGGLSSTVRAAEEKLEGLSYKRAKDEKTMCEKKWPAH